MRNIKRFYKFVGCFVAFYMVWTNSTDAQSALAYTNNKSFLNANGQAYTPGQKSPKEKQTLYIVLKDLNQKKGVYFLFSEENMGNKLVNPVKDMQSNVERILSEILKNTGLKHKKVSDNTFVILNEGEKVKGGVDYTEANFDVAKVLNDVVSPTTRKFEIISGRLTAPDGTPLQGVSVLIKGTRKGTTTNARGEFSIDANKGDVLVFSSVGYNTQEITVGDSKTLNLSLATSSQEINEVVVTALGIKKERKALGYSVTEVNGSDLTQAREVNVANGLVGKVAGLNVNSIAGGPGASSNVIIRGISSLGQTNQPLYVINGVPMESQPNGNPGGQYDNAPDLGDAVSNLNPDDIETISVLKGAAASALYGYRAKAGVILITTKSAKGTGIEYNSNYVGEQIIDPTNWQYVYGQGANNIKPATQTAAAQAGQSSYGAKLDGSGVIQFDGVSRPYAAQKNNLKNFYRTGGTFTNTIAFSKSFTGGALRFSASNLSNNSVVPNAGLDRQTFNLTANFNPTKRLIIDARANYILEQAKNRPMLSDGAGNANFNVMFMPTSLDVNVLKQRVNPDGSEFVYTSTNPYATNPWFAAYNFINNTDRNRLIGSASARYNFDNGFFVQGRVGRDGYNDRYTSVVPSGTAYRPNGSISETSTKFWDVNVDGLAGKSFNITNDFIITPNVGASYRRTKSETITNSGSDFAVFGVYNILNAKNKSANYVVSDQEVQSVYGTLELAYEGYLYLNGSVRNDWFSTLATPGKDNKLYILYPSVSSSFIFTELWKPAWLSFGKLRAGYAVVGQATTPYNTQLSYTLNSATLNGRPLGSILNTSVPNSSLKPSQASEFEIGTELRFGNRLNVDLTWYTKKSTNEILSAPASITSGYTGATLNIGELQNRGFEALVSAKLIKTPKFSWTSSINGSINNNQVISLAAGQAQFAIGTSRSGVGSTANIVGLPAVQVMAYDYKYGTDGKIVLDGNGLPARGDLVPWGSAYHKWVGGWNNEFSCKRFNLSFLIDGKFGGKIFSATDFYGYLFGLHQATLVNREGKFGTNNNIDAATYYSTFSNNISKVFVQNASFIKFRQLTLGYSIPAKVFSNIIQGINISLVARNLFTLKKHTDNIDPEGNYTAFAQGLELGGVPPVRTFGVNLNVKL